MRYRGAAPAGGGGDIDFANVAMLLHFDGADGDSVITDSSSYARTMTRQGTAEVDTAQSVFGGSSGYIPASTNGWTTPGGTGLDMRAGAFQFDFRLRPTTAITSDSDSEMRTIASMLDGSGWPYEWAVIMYRTYFRFYRGYRGASNKSNRFFLPPGYDFNDYGATWAALSIARDATGKWGAWIEGHRCVDYQEGIDGGGEAYNARVNGGILTDATDMGSSSGKILNIGRFYSFSGLSHDQHLDEFRYVVGECRDVTSDYTPETSPFPDS